MLYIEPFIKYTVHIGHSALNSLMLSSWFFHKLQKKIWTINILKTVIFLKIILKFFKYIVTYNFPFWFINLELTKEFLFKKFSNSCGEFSCTRVWIRGFLSNFKSIQHSISKYILKKHIIKNFDKNYLINYWFMTRFTWPRGIFLSDVIFNYIVSKEAASMSLPVAAMIDTNIKSFLFTFPIPSNDDAIESVCYIISILSKNLLLLKYKKLMLWYTHYSLKKKQLLYILSNLQKINQNTVLGLLKLKLNKFITLNYFEKFKNNMKLLTRKIKNKKNKILSVQNITQFNILLYRKQNFFKKFSKFFCFLKKSLKLYKFKITKRYKKLITNFIKLDKSKLVFRNRRRNAWRQDAAVQYFSTNYYLSTVLLKLTNIFYESYMNPRIADLSVMVRTNRWLTTKYRFLLRGMLRRPVVKFWLYPFIRKFSIKRSKYRWFHSVLFYKESNDSKFFFNWKKKKIAAMTLKYYNNWFFFLLTKLKK